MCYKAAHHAPWRKHRHHAKKRHHGRMPRWAYPPASIEELDDRYEIRIYAAGYDKSDFQVGLEDDHLLIKVQKDTSDDPVDHQRLRGYVPGSFERHFALNPRHQCQIRGRDIEGNFAEEGRCRNLPPGY